MSAGNLPLTLLVAAGTLGAIDVFYYHIYRFRLFQRTECVAEEITHLIRHAVFLALLVLLSSGSSSRAVDLTVLGLFGLDIVNSAVDVLLERRSRETLGGLPSGEYLIHTLSSFGMGVAVAAYVFARPTLPLPAPTGILALQVKGMLGVGLLLFVVEGALFGAMLAGMARQNTAKSTTRIPRFE
jgi:hypothetical protein